jgi:hypothetical protein
MSGIDVSTDPICYNLITVRKLAACVSSAVRPKLAGAVQESPVIPVDVRIRLACDDTFALAKPISGPKPARALRPIGSQLDCYM